MRGTVANRGQVAIAAVLDREGQSPGTRSDDRRSGRHRLDRDQSERLVTRGNGNHIRCGIEDRQLILRLGSPEYESVVDAKFSGLLGEYRQRSDRLPKIVEIPANDMRIRG